VKFDIGDFHKNLSIKSKFCCNQAQISGTLREELSRFIVAGGIKSPSKRSLWLRWYQAVRIAEEPKQYANPPRFYVIPIPPVFLFLLFSKRPRRISYLRRKKLLSAEDTSKGQSVEIRTLNLGNTCKHTVRKISPSSLLSKYIKNKWYKNINCVFVWVWNWVPYIEVSKEFGGILRYKEGAADPSGRVVWGVGLRPSACWDRGFEFHRGHGCLSCTMFVLSGRGLCNRPIPRPEESYRLWCVLEYDQMKSQKPSTPAVNK
jgi:hypothetical protein